MINMADDFHSVTIKPYLSPRRYFTYPCSGRSKRNTALQAETSSQHCAIKWNGVGNYSVLGTLSYQYYEPTPPARAGIQSNIKVCIKMKAWGSPQET